MHFCYNLKISQIYSQKRIQNNNNRFFLLRSIPGGVAILGIYSLSNYFTFIPPEDSCGLVLSVSPLQVNIDKLSLLFIIKQLNIFKNITQWLREIVFLLIHNFTSNRLVRSSTTSIPSDSERLTIFLLIK